MVNLGVQVYKGYLAISAVFWYTMNEIPGPSNSHSSPATFLVSPSTKSRMAQILSAELAVTTVRGVTFCETQTHKLSEKNYLIYTGTK